MIEVGVLGPEYKVELLFGKIVPTSPVGRAHRQTITKIIDTLASKPMLRSGY